MRDTDARPIALLKANAREPAASLARKRGPARSTVQERVSRLEREGTILGHARHVPPGGRCSLFLPEFGGSVLAADSLGSGL